jgi:CheY-like chemotaxis protein
MLEAGELTPTQQRKAFEVIDRNLTAQAQLIDDLLNVSRIVTGKLMVELRPVFPAPIIEEAIDSIRPTAKTKSLKLTRDLDTALGPIQIDPPRFHQIVWNLLTNAVKFTPKKGHIHVSLRRINSNALLQISDSGEGINPDFIPYIFERFRQADASRSRKYGGLGVGLSIAKSLVEQHGGTIYAESDGVGKGSTFNVTLPIPGLSSHSDSASQQTTIKSMLKGKRILVVEDEPDTRDMIAHAVKQRGAKPIQADSARKALQVLEQEPCDLVISDIGMPDLDGYAFIRKLRSLKSPASAVPVIALTAYAGEHDRKLSIEAGFNTHIPKPITLTELVRVISKLIGERQKLSA